METLTMEKITVIPSEVEGFRCESLRVAQRDPSTNTRDDDLVGCALRNSLSAPDQSDKRKHEFHPFNNLIRGYPGTAGWLGDGCGSNHRAKSGAIIRWKISCANSERSRGCTGRQNRGCRREG